jgi:hypothetical protein
MAIRALLLATVLSGTLPGGPALAETGAASAETARGFHLGVSVGAGYSYDGLFGLRLEGRYSLFALSVGLGRDALPSTETYGTPTHTTVTSSGPHSLAGSLRFLSGGSEGLVASLTVWTQWEHATNIYVPEPHGDDRYWVIQPALGWRWRFEPLFLELSIGLPINHRRASPRLDEPGFPTGMYSTNSIGFTGCTQCDAMPLPSAEVGIGFSY